MPEVGSRPEARSDAIEPGLTLIVGALGYFKSMFRLLTALHGVFAPGVADRGSTQGAVKLVNAGRRILW
jgi:hypothetical protein